MEWTIDEASPLKTAKNISNAMQEYKVTRCLIDHSAISSVAGDAIRVYNRPVLLKSIGIPRHIKIAEMESLPMRAHRKSRTKMYYKNIQKH